MKSIKSTYYRNSQLTPTRTTIKKDYQKEDYSQIMGRIRVLEDDLFTEQLRNQQLERKCLQYLKNIQDMHVELIQMEDQLRRVKQSQMITRRKNIEIAKYQQNLISIGSQISNLNDCLTKKNNQYQQILKQNQAYLSLNISLEEQLNRFKYNQQTYRNKLQEIIDAIKIQRQPLSFNNQINNKIDFIKQTLQSMKNDRKKYKQLVDKSKRQVSQLLLQEKQKYIKLQYQLKLLKQRRSDNQKKYDFMQNYMKDQQIQSVIQQMLKKQDQLIDKIQHLQMQNQELKTKFSQQMFNLQYQLTQQIKLSNQKVLQLDRQNKLLKKDIEKMKQSFKSTTYKYQKIIESTNRQSYQEMDTDIHLMKKLRTAEEQNKLLKIKTEQLMSEINILRNQIDIFKE